MVSVFFGVPRGGGLSFFSWFVSLFVLDFSSFFDVVAWESLVVVGDVKSSISSTFHGSENSVSGGGSHETNIQVGLEWSLFNRLGHNVEVFSVDVFNSLELVSQF